MSKAECSALRLPRGLDVEPGKIRGLLLAGISDWISDRKTC